MYLNTRKIWVEYRDYAECSSGCRLMDVETGQTLGTSTISTPPRLLVPDLRHRKLATSEQQDTALWWQGL